MHNALPTGTSARTCGEAQGRLFGQGRPRLRQAQGHTTSAKREAWQCVTTGTLRQEASWRRAGHNGIAETQRGATNTGRRKAHRNARTSSQMSTKADQYTSRTTRCVEKTASTTSTNTSVRQRVGENGPIHEQGDVTRRKRRARRARTLACGSAHSQDSRVRSGGPSPTRRQQGLHGKERLRAVKHDVARGPKESAWTHNRRSPRSGPTRKRQDGPRHGRFCSQRANGHTGARRVIATCNSSGMDAEDGPGMRIPCARLRGLCAGNRGISTQANTAACLSETNGPGTPRVGHGRK